MLQILKTVGIYDARHICFYAAAASGGNLHILEWVLENDKCLPDETFSAAAAGNNLNILKWAVERGFKLKFNLVVMNVAAIKGRLEMLKYLYSQGAVIDDACIVDAVKSGSLEVVEWLIGIGVKWTDDAYDEAVRRGNKETLEWVHKWMIN